MPILPRHVIIDDTVLTHYNNTMGIICDHVRSHDILPCLVTDCIKSHAFANWIMWSVGLQRSCGSHVIMWDHMWSSGITCDHMDHMWSCESHAIMWITCDHVGSHVIMMMWDHMWSWSHVIMIMWKLCDHVRSHVLACWVMWSHALSHTIINPITQVNNHVGSHDHVGSHVTCTLDMWSCEITCQD